MTEPLALLPKHNRSIPDVVARSAVSFEHVRAVEIVAPDGYCAALLVGYASPMFPAEIVSGSTWIVRFKPPPSEGDWVVDLLTVVEHWLESARLPSAELLHGGKRDMIHAPTGGHARDQNRSGPDPAA